jgi:inner membrane protein
LPPACFATVRSLGNVSLQVLKRMTWFLIFAALVFSFYFWRQYRAHHRLGLKHIGQAVVLEKPLENGSGRIRLGNRDWAVRGPTLPAGARVRVTGVDGTVLLVDRAPA